MEDEKPSLSDSSTSSARSATALRELESRARAALTAQRQQMLRLEFEITSQLDSIEETLAAQQAADSADSTQTEAASSQLEQLREEAKQARLTWETAQAAQQAECAELRTQLSEQQREQTEQAARLKELERQLADKETALAEQAAALKKHDAERCNQDQALEAIRLERDADKKSQADREAEWEAERAKWLAERTAWDAEKSAWDAERMALEEAQATAEAECAKRDVEKTAWEQECAGWNVELTAWATEQQAWTEERTAWDAERVAWEKQRETWTAEREELTERLARLGTQQNSSQEKLLSQIVEFEQQLADARAAMEQQQAERAAANYQLEAEQSSHNADKQAWESARLALEAERDELKLTLFAAREELQSAGEQAAVATERDELRQKFELALNDVQRFRSRAAELEQELARRPAADQTDSAELVALRAERDALASRIEELERTPKSQVDADMERQTADLQRRFEMAVEDVRELKTKNAKLESQLAERKPQSSGSVDSGGMDWESQKRRLLASLAEEGDDEDDASRQKDRATIANTIEITDAVVAEKDREIEELRLQLAAGVGKTESTQTPNDAAVDELVDADEVVQSHRKRLAELEKQMEETLRKAELELSVERAKMARQKSELELLRDELTQRESQVGPASGVVIPKKRWLSKLGLSGDDPG